tara:strand:+ start:581 stop:1159 length:579 start_codon:yes stop_codon:yes gene_type:complete
MTDNWESVHKPYRGVIFDKWYMYPNFLNNSEIDKLETSVANIEYENSTIIAGSDTSYRDSKNKWVPFEESWLYDKVWDAVSLANKELWNFEIEGFVDNAQYTHYESPNGHYDWHLDIMANGINHRKISVICALNDDFVGGNVEFKFGKTNEIVELSKGGAVFFPSFYLHRVTPIISGERKSLVQWVSGEPYR